MLDNLKFIGTLLRRYRDIGTFFSNKKKYRDCPDGIGTVNRSAHATFTADMCKGELTAVR